MHIHRHSEGLLIGAICYMSASIQLFIGAWMYSFLLSENSVSSELLENLHVDHKRLTQSKNGVVTFDFKMKLGSTFVKRSISGEILLYVGAVVYRDREYSNFEELLCIMVYIVFRQNSIFCPFQSILIYLSCRVKCGSITGNS